MLEPARFAIERSFHFYVLWKVQVQEVEEPGECEPRARCAVKLEWGIEWGQPYYRSDLDLHARKLDRDGEASYSPQSSHLFFGQMCLGRCELLKDINRTETKVVRWPKEMMTLDEAGSGEGSLRARENAFIDCGKGFHTVHYEGAHSGHRAFKGHPCKKISHCAGLGVG